MDESGRDATFGGRIAVVEGDITTLDVDAIVNAANSSLLLGSGVAGAIRAAAGPGLQAECSLLAPCPTGEARITGGHRLPARFVIHAVGPIWDGGRNGEPELLRSCYVESLRLAEEYAVQSVAFPAISAGIYGYPPDQACEVAVSAVSDWLSAHEAPRSVIFCCFGEQSTSRYRRRLGLDG